MPEFLVSDVVGRTWTVDAKNKASAVEQVQWLREEFEIDMFPDTRLIPNLSQWGVIHVSDCE